MSEIEAYVAGARELEVQFDTLPAKLRAQLKPRIESLTDRMAALVRAAVPKKSGQLASKVVTSVSETLERVSGRVSFSGDWAKAGALEYGAHRKSAVSTHEMRLAHLWGRAIAQPMLVQVPGHDRQMNIAAHNFMHGAEAAMKDQVLTELTEAVDATTKV